MTGSHRKSCGPAAGAVAAALMALALGACASTSGARQIFLPDVPKVAETVSATSREHQRVLTAYGGAYEDTKLQAKLASVVDRLVAASERPDLAYKITIL